MDTIRYAQIWGCGSDAFKSGWKIGENPYPKGSPEYHAWERGYQGAEGIATNQANWRKLIKIKH